MIKKVLPVIFVSFIVQWARTDDDSNTDSDDSDVFSSVADIVKLKETHKYVIDAIQQYLEGEDEKLYKIRTHLNKLQIDHEHMESEHKYAGNPINAFSLIHSLTDELKRIQYYTKIDNSAELNPPDDLLFPLEGDLEGAAVALWRLQKMYKLNATLLANGILRGTYSHGNKLFEEKSSPMSISMLFAVGRKIFSQKDYGTSLQWLHEALKKYYNPDPMDPYPQIYNESHIIDYMRNAYHGIRDFKNAIKWTKKLTELCPLQNELNKSIVLLYSTLLELNKTVSSRAFDDGLQFKNTFNYPKLCRGELPLPEHKRQFLNCYYKHGPSQFLQLAPVKTEELHHEPDVFLFYDVISDEEIENIQQSSASTMMRSRVSTKPVGSVSRNRISKGTWLKNDLPIPARLTMRVADFTGFDMASAEQLQVANYGIGGHYAPHYDFNRGGSDIYLNESGNRIATVLFYMSDVEQGGATVFPGKDVQLTVFPVKNAALFWLNLLGSGQPDYRTIHAACPVLRGSKWAGNKWIRQFGQEFIMPCGLDDEPNQDESDQDESDEDEPYQDEPAQDDFDQDESKQNKNFTND